MTIKLRQCVLLIYFLSYLEKTYTITAQEPSIDGWIGDGWVGVKPSLKDCLASFDT